MSDLEMTALAKKVEQAATEVGWPAAGGGIGDDNQAALGVLGGLLMLAARIIAVVTRTMPDDRANRVFEQSLGSLRRSFIHAREHERKWPYNRENFMRSACGLPPVLPVPPKESQH